MRVLVTGAAGHLGALVVARLARAGHRVRALDLPRRGSMRRLAAHGAAVEPFPGDVGDRRRLAEAAVGVDAIAHLAGVLPPRSERSPALARRVNDEGTAALVDAAARHAPAARLVLASSFSVYGPEQAGRGLAGPDSPTAATDVYTTTKLAAEARVRDSTLDWTILRIAASIEGSAAAVDPLALRLMFEVDPEQPIELVHGEDVATAVCRALTAPGASRQVLPIGGGPSCRLRQRELFALTFGALGLDALPTRAHGRGPYYTCWLDTAASQALLGYQERGLEDIRRDLVTNLGVRAALARLARPLVRRVLLRHSGPYRGAPPRPTWQALIDAGF